MFSFGIVLYGRCVVALIDGVGSVEGYAYTFCIVPGTARDFYESSDYFTLGVARGGEMQR